MDASSTHEPAIDALRIQAAALVAQQSAIFDRELRVQERESALAQQEVQLSDLLEDKRRQLLELQDQITAAREDLRRQRAELQDVATQQACAVKLARDQAADMLGEAKAKRAKIARLQRRIWNRWQRERQRHAETEAELATRRRQVDSDRAQWLEDVAKHNGRVELDQRQLQDGWRRLQHDRQAWKDHRSKELRDLNRRLRDLAQRDKAIASAEARHEAEQRKQVLELAERRREIEHLETRIGHARQRLLELQSDDVASRPSAPAPDLAVRPPALAMNVRDDSRWQLLTQVTHELVDQRYWLCEQIGRLNQARQQWLAERDAAIAELNALADELHRKEQKLSRRARDLISSQLRQQADAVAVNQLRLRIEAERTQREAELLAQQHDLNRRIELLTAREARAVNRESRLNDVLQSWGRRRRTEIEKMRMETQDCRSERAEWMAACDAWLHAHHQIVGERRDLVARAMAFEQLREEWQQSADGKALARKRLERLERQWVAQFNADVRELDRLRNTIESETARMNELADRTRADRLAAFDQLAALEEKTQQLEAERFAVEAERIRIAERAEVEQYLRATAETHVLELRNEVEGLSRLLIDAPASIHRAA